MIIRGNYFAWLAVLIVLLSAGTVLADIPAPPIKRLDDPTRVKVLAAIASLVILGFGMVLLTWLGARFAQRYRQSTPYLRATSRPGEHDWARRPLSSPKSEPIDPRAE